MDARIAEEERWSDRRHCAAFALFGPIALLITLIAGTFGHGMKYR